MALSYQPKSRGYPVDIIDQDEVEPKFICGLCKNLLKEPIQSYCGHRFCQDCITFLIRYIDY